MLYVNYEKLFTRRKEHILNPNLDSAKFYCIIFTLSRLSAEQLP